MKVVIEDTCASKRVPAGFPDLPHASVRPDAVAVVMTVPVGEAASVYVEPSRAKGVTTWSALRAWTRR